MTSLGFQAVDADNHYYEAPDAFTRHIEPAMKKRAMQWADIDGKRRLLVGGKVNRFIPNPLFDPVARPGVLDEYFRAKNADGKDIAALFGELEPIRPEYRDRDARLKVMDDQGLEACFLFPTLAVGMEEALRDDIPALVAAFRAFNRWLDDDWGFDYRDRIFAAPYITMADVDAAIAEVEWVIERGARLVCMRPAPVPTATGSQSPGHRDYDPVWARLNEAGLTVGFHGGDSGYGRYVNDWESTEGFEAFRYSAFRTVVMAERYIFDTMAALVCHGLFDRFPNLRIASIETGSSWVVPLLKKLKKASGQMPFAFTENPTDTFKRHVWVSPYYEDNLAQLKEGLGVERILFGSDWPHAEGLAKPLNFVDDLTRHGYERDEIRRVMRENALALKARKAAVAA
jgi:predicted TIM-barrel fold metal-dependent hydrolase